MVVGRCRVVRVHVAGRARAHAMCVCLFVDVCVWCVCDWAEARACARARLCVEASVPPPHSFPMPNVCPCACGGVPRAPPQIVKLKAFEPFATAEAALHNINDISEGILPEDLRNFLERNLPRVKEGKKAKFSLGVLDAKIGTSIQVCALARAVGWAAAPLARARGAVACRIASFFCHRSLAWPPPRRRQLAG